MRIPKIYDYYQDYLPVNPNYAILSQKYILLKNIRRKRKVKEVLNQQEEEEKCWYKNQNDDFYSKILKSELMHSYTINKSVNSIPSFLEVKEVMDERVAESVYKNDKCSIINLNDISIVQLNDNDNNLSFMGDLLIVFNSLSNLSHVTHENKKIKPVNTDADFDPSRYNKTIRSPFKGEEVVYELIEDNNESVSKIFNLSHLGMVGNVNQKTEENTEQKGFMNKEKKLSELKSTPAQLTSKKSTDLKLNLIKKVTVSKKAFNTGKKKENLNKMFIHSNLNSSTKKGEVTIRKISNKGLADVGNDKKGNDDTTKNSVQTTEGNLRASVNKKKSNPSLVNPSNQTQKGGPIYNISVNFNFNVNVTQSSPQNKISSSPTCIMKKIPPPIKFADKTPRNSSTNKSKFNNNNKSLKKVASNPNTGNIKTNTTNSLNSSLKYVSTLPSLSNRSPLKTCINLAKNSTTSKITVNTPSTTTNKRSSIGSFEHFKNTQPSQTSNNKFAIRTPKGKAGMKIFDEQIGITAGSDINKNKKTKPVNLNFTPRASTKTNFISFSNTLGSNYKSQGNANNSLTKKTNDILHTTKVVAGNSSPKYTESKLLYNTISRRTNSIYTKTQPTVTTNSRTSTTNKFFQQQNKK